MRRSTPILRSALAAALLALCGSTVVGCAADAPAEPKDLFPPGSTTNDPAIDAVLALLDRADAATSTVAYRIVRRMGNVASTASVRRDGGERVVDFGSVVFRQGGAGERTCTTSGACSAGWTQQRISDLGVSAAFWGASAARRLRRDAAAKIGTAAARQTTIAGQPATCADVALGPGTATYCAFADGMLAKIVEGDVFVDADSYSA